MRHYDPSSNEHVDIEATVVRTTDKAVLLEVDGDERWVGKSKTDLDANAELGEGEVITIGIERWILRDNGWAE